MERSRKLCIISHCLLNCNAKVESPCSRYKGVLKELLYGLIENDYGIIQLPCPETTYYGMRRWGHVREQFDNPHFRKHCKEILEPVIDQMKDYLSNGYRLDYVIGVNGSPSCGIDMSCSSYKWKGEISRWESIDYIKGSLEYKEVPGIFMEELMSLLEVNNMKTKFIGIYENRIDEYDFMKMFK